MAGGFSELVIEGSFVLVKGFLVGFLSGAEKDTKYYFHRKEGIRRETLKEFVKELLDVDNYVHLCLENSTVARFVAAVENAHDKIGIAVKSVKNIQSSSFTFSYEIYNNDTADTVKKMFDKARPHLDLIDFRHVEIHDEEAQGSEGYAPEHAYTARGSGKAEGDLGNVLDLYLTIKRSHESDLINASEISLVLEDKVKNLT